MKRSVASTEKFGLTLEPGPRCRIRTVLEEDDLTTLPNVNPTGGNSTTAYLRRLIMRTRAAFFMSCILSFTLLSNLAIGQQVDNAKSKSGGGKRMTAEKAQQSEAAFFCS